MIEPLCQIFSSYVFCIKSRKRRDGGNEKAVENIKRIQEEDEIEGGRRGGGGGGGEKRENVWPGPRAVNPETVLRGGPGDNAQSFRNGN